MSAWIPEEDGWLFDAIKAVQRKMERRGVGLSRSEIIRHCLKLGLAEHGEGRDAGTGKRTDVVL